MLQTWLNALNELLTRLSVENTDIDQSQELLSVALSSGP